MFLSQERNKKEKMVTEVSKVQLIASGSRPAVNLKDTDLGMLNADNGEDLLRELFPNNPLPPSPMVNYFLPLQLLHGVHEKLLNNNDNASNDYTISGDILRLIGSPAALILDTCQSVRNDNLKLSTVNDQHSNIMSKEWINDNKYSTTMNFLTKNGFNNSDDSINSTVIPNIVSFDYCGIACRSSLCCSVSNTTKECYIFNLIFSDERLLSHGIPPLIYKLNIKNAEIVSFTVSDIAIKLANTENNDMKEKLNNKNKKNTTLINKVPNILDEKDIITGKDAIAFVGDSDGNLHFVIFSKASILQTGMFHAHSAPVVAVVVTDLSYWLRICEHRDSYSCTNIK